MITSKATEPIPVKQLTMPLRLAQQNMATTNTLAYFVTESVAKKKRIAALTPPRVCNIKYC